MKKRYDFDALMEPVARRVWGEPNHTKEGVELRWGNHGSRRVNLKMGSWANEERGTGGKLLKFLKFELQLETWPEQREWLENGGFIPRRRGAGNGAGGYVSRAAPSVAPNGGGAPPTPPVAPNALAAPAEPPKKPRQRRGKFDVAYPYRDELGVLLYQVVRWKDPKGFSQRRPNPKVPGEWISGRGGIEKVLFLLPELIEALKARNQQVGITEGEKDALTVREAGIPATCSPEGADATGSKWLSKFNERFRGVDVVLFVHNDAVGRLYMHAIAAQLVGIARSIKWFDISTVWEECGPKQDVSDYAGEKGNRPQLLQWIKDAPTWIAPDPVTLSKLRAEMAAEAAKDKAEQVGEAGGAGEKHDPEEEQAAPPLYRQNDVIQAVAEGHPIAIVKEEAEVDALWEIGVPATTHVTAATNSRQTALHECLHGADIILVPNNDDAGYSHINQVGQTLLTIVKRIRVLRLAPIYGVSAWFESGGNLDQWRMRIELAPDWVPLASFADPAAKAKAEAEEKELLNNLALMNEVEYDRQRKAAAKRLGIRGAMLDRTRERRRAELEEERGAPPLFGYWVVEPWKNEVDGDDLIRRIIARIRRHVVLRENQAIVAALWILLTWVHEAAVHSPILLINSPERDSGKSTLADLIRYLVRRGLSAVAVTGAALYRTIELHDVTFIVDEADHLLATNEDIKTVVNSGWTRGMVILRCVGDAQVPTPFSSFCPKLIAMKGRHLPDTTRSRCLPIALKPKKKSETVEPFESEDDEGLEELRRRAMRWAMDNVEALKGVRPAMPEELFNRRGANWRLIFAIADRAGSEWPQRVREAALEVSGVKEHADKSTGEQLLADIKTLLEERVLKKEADHAFIETEKILNFLHAMEDRPWSEFGKHEKPITSTKLAGILSGYGVTPFQFRDKEGKKKRGYIISHFDDPFERYPA